MRVCVFLDVEVLLHLAAGIGENRPLRANRGPYPGLKPELDSSSEPMLVGVMASRGWVASTGLPSTRDPDARARRSHHGLQPAARPLLSDGAVQAAAGDPLRRAAGVEGRLAGPQSPVDAESSGDPSRVSHDGPSNDLIDLAPNLDRPKPQANVNPIATFSARITASPRYAFLTSGSASTPSTTEAVASTITTSRLVPSASRA